MDISTPSREGFHIAAQGTQLSTNCHIDVPRLSVPKVAIREHPVKRFGRAETPSGRPSPALGKRPSKAVEKITVYVRIRGVEMFVDSVENALSAALHASAGYTPVTAE
jgi:hypothetical protein